MGPFSNASLIEYIEKYCRQKGVESSSLIRYITSAENILREPQCFWFLHTLADAVNEFPQESVKMFECFVRQSIKREILKKRLSEKVMEKRWRESQVIQSTAALAYWGVRKGIYELTEDHLQRFAVTDDSFKCGLLLRKCNLHQKWMKAIFSSHISSGVLCRLTLLHC